MTTIEAWEAIRAICTDAVFVTIDTTHGGATNRPPTWIYHARVYQRWEKSDRDIHVEARNLPALVGLVRNEHDRVLREAVA